MKLKIATDKDSEELAETLYSVVGDKFTVSWIQADDYIVAETDKVLTDEQVSQFLQESNSSLARTIRGDKISQETRDALKTDISNIQDTATKAALEDIYHLLTGEKL